MTATSATWTDGGCSRTVIGTVGGDDAHPRHEKSRGGPDSSSPCASAEAASASPKRENDGREADAWRERSVRSIQGITAGAVPC